MNEIVLLICMLLSTLMFLVLFGKSAFAKNVRIFIFMVIRIISEKIQELRRKNNHD